MSSDQAHSQDDEAVADAVADGADASTHGGDTDAAESGAARAEAAGDQVPAGVDANADADADADDAQTAAQAEEELDPLAVAEFNLAAAQDDLKRAHAEYYNLQQEYEKYVRRAQEAVAGHRENGIQSVVEALIPVLDEVELARTHGDLTGPVEAIANKLESILSDKYSLERYGEVGDPFDPAQHEALMATESADVSEPTVAAVLQPGYRMGERIVRATRVQVAHPA